MTSAHSIHQFIQLVDLVYLRLETGTDVSALRELYGCYQTVVETVSCTSLWLNTIVSTGRIGTNAAEEKGWKVGDFRIVVHQNLEDCSGATCDIAKSSQTLRSEISDVSELCNDTETIPSPLPSSSSAATAVEKEWSDIFHSFGISLSVIGSLSTVPSSTAQTLRLIVAVSCSYVEGERVDRQRAEARVWGETEECQIFASAPIDTIITTSSGRGGWFADMISGVAWLVTAHLSDGIDDKKHSVFTHFVLSFGEDKFGIGCFWL